MVIARSTLKVISLYVTCMAVTVFLFTGCTLISPARQKDTKEEKEIFGFLDGYNHRIKEAQGYLMRAEFNPGPIDGKMHRSTRKAIKDFQRDNGLKITGFIGAQTWTKLSNYDKVIGKVGQKKKKEGGPLKDHSSSLEGVREIQLALKNSGFDPGSIDGKIGPKTRKAIMDFQAAKGLSPNGTIDSKTCEALNKYSIKE